VLADVSPSLTPQQRKTLSEAIRPLLVRRVALRLNANAANAANAKPPRIEPGPREENGETHIRLFYKSGDEEIEVDLSFGARPGNTTATPPRVVDATVAGTNLSKNLRASVNKVMRKEGFDGLVARLKQLRDETSTGPHKSSALTL
jgi:ABC-type transporter MlaC component